MALRFGWWLPVAKRQDQCGLGGISLRGRRPQGSFQSALQRLVVSRPLFWIPDRCISLLDLSRPQPLAAKGHADPKASLLNQPMKGGVDLLGTGIGRASKNVVRVGIG